MTKSRFHGNLYPLLIRAIPGTDPSGHACLRPDSEVHDKPMLAKDKKNKIIKKFQTHTGDTGSSQVQVAILTSEIEELAEHLKAHHKDHSSRRGLLRKVGERRRLLRYMKKEDAAGYEDLVKKLKLKDAKQFGKVEETPIEDVVLEENEAELS